MPSDLAPGSEVKFSGDGVLPDQMPPIATEQSDANALATVRAWISAMPRDWVTLPPLGGDLDGGVNAPAPDIAAPDAGPPGPLLDASPAGPDAWSDAAEPADAGAPSSDAAQRTAPTDASASANDGAASSESDAADPGSTSAPSAADDAADVPATEG